MDERDPNAADRRASFSPLFGPHNAHPAAPAVRVTIGARSHEGVVRLSNDDHFLVLRMGRDLETLASSLSSNELPALFRENAYAMFVADGLGAGGAGAVASRVALSTIAYLALYSGEWNIRVDDITSSQIVDRAEWFYRQADVAVHARAGASPVLTGMTTSLTAAYSAGADLFIAHVGHSRAYRFRDGHLARLTRDHTLEQQFADNSGRTPTPVERHAQDLRHILTSSIGSPGGDPAIDVDQFRLLNGDCVMLCTNGVTDMLDDGRIAEILSQRRAPDEQCRMLIEMANRAGGGDNSTVVLAEYHIGD